MTEDAVRSAVPVTDERATVIPENIGSTAGAAQLSVTRHVSIKIENKSRCIAAMTAIIRSLRSVSSARCNTRLAAHVM